MMDIPLSKQDLANLRNALFELNESEQIIDLAQRCKLPCDEEDARCRHLKEALTAINETFGPLVRKK